MIGTGRHVRYRVQFVNGNVIELARNRIWNRLIQADDMDFDEELNNDGDVSSVGSIGSKASISSNKSSGSAIQLEQEPKKERS